MFRSLATATFHIATMGAHDDESNTDVLTAGALGVLVMAAPCKPSTTSTNCLLFFFCFSMRPFLLVAIQESPLQMPYECNAYQEAFGIPSLTSLPLTL